MTVSPLQLRPPPTLSTLPYDILRLIASHLPTASCVASFSATSKYLNSFVALEGWRVFVQTRFPSFHAEVIRESQTQPRTVDSADWRTWAQEQTLVSRNWARRGFIAKVLEPEVFIHVPTGPRGRGRGGSAPGMTTKLAWTPSSSRGRQTMKYLPVLDVYESVWSGGDEVLGIGAGPDLVLRKRRGEGEVGWMKGWWWGFENRDERAGRDDVTAIQLLQPGEKGAYYADRGEVAVVGKANGKLEMVALRTDSGARSVGKPEVLARYETGSLMVKSASLLHRGGGNQEMLMSAVLSNSNVALYPVLTPDLPPDPAQNTMIQPVSEIVLPDGEIPWKTTFLSPSLLALGTTSSEPLSVFAVSPDEGIRKTPLRTFSAVECTGVKTMSVYATASLPTSTGSPESAGEVFLGGWYDGVSRYAPTNLLPFLTLLTLSRLHDLRSPSQFVASYADPIDAQTPIYSLAPLDRTRFIVGGGRHCILKIFDLRMPGSRTYDYLPTTQSDSPGWATYLAPPARYRPRSNNNADWESPVYALAVAASGKSVYAGAQGRVWQMDFVGSRRSTQSPRPMSPQPELQPSVRVRNVAVGKAKDVGTRLTMYEFGWTGTMYHQGPESEMGKKGIDGMDGRWRATLAGAGL